jgi:hypothetical protein
MTGAQIDELEADVRVFARFWMDNRDRLEPDGDEAYGDAVVLSAMTAAMRPDAVVAYEADADLGALGLNDLLLVDTPRVAGPEGDLSGLLSGGLPTLNPGVLIRFTGVAADDELASAPAPNQAWNRALRGFLRDNPDYEVVFCNRMFRRELADLVEATLPRFLDEPGSGLWLRKLGPRRDAG